MQPPPDAERHDCAPSRILCADIRAHAHPGLPSTQAETTNSEVYSILSLATVCVQAFVSIVALGGTDWFPAAALFVGLTLLCHHAIIHRRSRFEGETCSCAPFQCKDICNHETWVVAASVAAVISALHV